MQKNVLILSTSLRAGSNSDGLAKAFAEGAKEAGHRVELVSLAKKTIGCCKGCLACQSKKKCVILDDADEITEKMAQADVLVFATPVYYYGMSGQMKTMLDRANALFVSDYRFRDVYLLATAADDGEETVEGTIHGVKGWISCFAKARLAGTVFAGGVCGAGEIKGHKALEEAFWMGKKS